jgi:hypothetical protein
VSAQIRQWQEAEGLSDAQMADTLSQRLGRKISEQGYKITSKRRDSPAEWLHALHIAPQEPGPIPSGFSPASEDGDDARNAPKPGASSSGNLPLPFEPQSARMQIVLIYTAAGRGAALALRAPAVGEVWAQAAPGIADAYIRWAEENAVVARYLAMMTLGGPAGELVLLHGMLVVNTLIVSGRLNPAHVVPPEYREGQETDNLADDGSSVVNLREEDSDGDAGAVPPQGKPRRTRAAAK